MGRTEGEREGRGMGGGGSAEIAPFWRSSLRSTHGHRDPYMTEPAHAAKRAPVQLEVGRMPDEGPSRRPSRFPPSSLAASAL